MSTETIAERMLRAAETFAAFDHALPPGISLDYSPQSLEDVDALLLTAREGMPAKQLQLLPRYAGAYLGEVVRRRSPVKVEWVDATTLPGPKDPDNFAVLLSTKGLQLAPLGKPFKFIENGATESLAWFANVAQDLLSREATAM